jgi:sugar O-acyltransferase (sialic acid O-acetyltransferase NeuD family)
MLICGAGGHARELYHCFKDELNNIYFFDNINKIEKIDHIRVLNSFNELKEVFKDDKRFILGVGGVKARSFFYKKMVNAGGIHFSVCSKNIIARSLDQKIEGADIFPNTFLGPNIQIGVGTLINTRSNIHHDTIIGDFCDIAPSAILLGGVVVGDCTFIGSGATILPRIKIGNNVIIGAGSVVNSDIPSNVIALGVPAKVVKKI